MPSDKIDNFPLLPSDKRASAEAISKIKLHANNVLVRIEAAPEVSKGGIFLPPQARNSMQQEVKRCTVLAVGPGCYTGERCEGCLGDGYIEEDIWPDDKYAQSTVESGGGPEVRRETCSVCGGSGFDRRKPYVKPGDVVYFNYLSDHGEITIEDESGLRVVRDVVFQAVEETYNEEYQSESPFVEGSGEVIPKTRIRPLQDRILVRRSKELATSKGGIIIPDNAREKQVEGEVLAVGEGNRTKEGILIPVGVKPGEVVVFGKYDGNEIKFQGETLVLMKEDCALAVLEKQP